MKHGDKLSPNSSPIRHKTERLGYETTKYYQKHYTNFSNDLLFYTNLNYTSNKEEERKVLCMAKLNIRNRNKGKVDSEGKAKPANWEYRFEAAKIDGKRKHISKAGFKTKKDAEVAGTKALAEYNNAGLKFEPTEISVSDYLDYWLKNYCQMNIADSTMTAYKNIINNHFKPRVGHYRLKAVTTLVLQEMVNDIYVNRSFTKSFMKNILKVMKGSFKYAKVTAKLIQTNPAEDVSLPKMSPDAEAEEIIILTKENVNIILDRFKESPAVYYAILTAYYTGLRVSEVYGLTWDCVDFEKKKITVEKIVKKIEVNGKVSEKGQKRGISGKATTKWYFGACKTSSSYRTIDIGDTLIAALKEYKAMQEKNEEEYGDLYTKQYLKPEKSENNRNVQRLIAMQDMDFDIPLERAYPVFIKVDGSYRGTDTVKYASKTINYELGIHFNFHALRHTHATMLIEAGVPVKAVSDRLGHGNVRTTLETYVHVTERMKYDAVDKFEAMGSLDETATVVNFNDLKRKADSNAEAK